MRSYEASCSNIVYKASFQYYSYVHKPTIYTGCCRYGDNIRKFKPGGNVTRVANRQDVNGDGNSGDAEHFALDARLMLMKGMCLAMAPNQNNLYVTDSGSKRLRRVYCPINA